MRLITFQTNITGKRAWLAPVFVILAAIGAAVILVATAIFGAVFLVVSVAAKILTGPAQPSLNEGAARPSLFSRLVKKFLTRSPRPQDEKASETQTISLDRGKDGVWRP